MALDLVLKMKNSLTYSALSKRLEVCWAENHKQIYRAAYSR